MRIEGESGTAMGTRRLGAPPVVLKLSNSDPRVVELNRLTRSWGESNETYRLVALAPGVAELTLAVSDPEIRLANNTVRVAVVAADSVFVSPASVVLGKDLQTSVLVRVIGTAETTIVSDDPGAVLVSRSITAPGAAQVTQSLGQADFYLQALKGEGETIVRVKVHGLSDREIKVALLPSAAGFVGMNSSFTTGFNRRTSVTAWAYDPVTGSGIAAQAPRPGVEVAVTVRGEGVRVSTESVVLRPQSSPVSLDFTDPAEGTDGTLAADAGAFTGPPLVRVLRISRPAPLSVLAGLTLSGIDLVQHEMRGLSLGSPAAPSEVTVSSLNPDLVLLSTRATDPGASSVRLPPSSSNVVYFHGLSDAGIASVRFESPGRSPATLPVTLRPLALQIEGTVMPVGGTVSLAASWNAPSRSLLPGVGPWRFTVRSANPNIFTVQPETIEMGPSPGVSVRVQVTGHAPGLAELVAEGPPGIYTPVTRIRVDPVNPSFTTFTVGRNLQRAVTLPLGVGAQNPNGAVLTITSSDPSKVVLSRTPSAEGTGSIVVAATANSPATQQFYVQALSGEGEVTLSAPEFPNLRAVIRLTPSWVGCGTTPSPVLVSVGSTTTLQCSGRFPAVTALSTFDSLPPRPGVDASLRLSGEPAGLVAITPEAVSLTSDTTPQFALRGVAPGEGFLRVEQPSGFGPAPDGSDLLPVRIELPFAPTGCGRELNLGKDTQLTCQLQIPAGTAVTVRSLDPSLLVVSADPGILGGPTATVSSDARASISLQGLAASGTAELVFSAPGHQDTLVAVALRRTMLQVSPSSGSLVVRRGATASVEVSMPSGAAPRAGANLVAEFIAEPAGIVTFDPPRLTFTPAQNRLSVQIRATNPGSAVIRLNVPEGFVASGVPLAVSVVE
jgi:hypothetical protein